MDHGRPAGALGPERNRLGFRPAVYFATHHAKKAALVYFPVWPHAGRYPNTRCLPEHGSDGAEDKMAKKKRKATGRRSGEEPDEADGKGQLPSLIDWPRPECLPMDEEQDDEE